MSDTITGLPSQLFIAQEDGIITVDLDKIVSWTDHDYDTPRKFVKFMGTRESGAIDFWGADNIDSVANDGNVFLDKSKAQARAEVLKKEEDERQARLEARERERERERAKEAVDGGSF